MRKIYTLFLIAILFLMLPESSSAQFRKDAGNPNISGILNVPGTDVLFGLIDPSRLNMHHSVNMSYGSFGSNGMMLSTYMNFMDYQVTDKLMIRTNLGVMTSPYNTMGDNFYLNKPRFVGGAQLEYKMSENSSVFFSIQSQPYYHYSNYRPGLGAYNQQYLP